MSINRLKSDVRFSNNFVVMILGLGFLQAMLSDIKNAARVLGCFAFRYGYSENFKNLLLRKHEVDFQIIL